MRQLVRFGVVAVAVVALASASVRGQEAPPAWAYVANPPDFTAAAG